MAVLEEVKTRLGPDDAAQVRAAAEARGMSVAEVVRQAVQEYLARREGDRVLPLLDEALAKHVDRLAALTTKAIVSAGVAAWEANYLIGVHKDGKTARRVMRAAVLRAVMDMHRKGVAVGEAPEEEYRVAEDAAAVWTVRE